MESEDTNEKFNSFNQAKNTFLSSKSSTKCSDKAPRTAYEKEGKIKITKRSCVLQKRAFAEYTRHIALK